MPCQSRAGQGQFRDGGREDLNGSSTCWDSISLSPTCNAPQVSLDLCQQNSWHWSKEIRWRLAWTGGSIFPTCPLLQLPTSSSKCLNLEDFLATIIADPNQSNLWANRASICGILHMVISKNVLWRVSSGFYHADECSLDTSASMEGQKVICIFATATWKSSMCPIKCWWCTGLPLFSNVEHKLIFLAYGISLLSE